MKIHVKYTTVCNHIIKADPLGYKYTFIMGYIHKIHNLTQSLICNRSLFRLFKLFFSLPNKRYFRCLITTVSASMNYKSTEKIPII